MKKVNWKELNIKPHNIVVAVTSEPDYEMSRTMLLEFEYDKLVVLEGWHCSCFDFDDTEWEAIEYTREEIKRLSSSDYYKEDSFWEQVKAQYC